MSIDRDFRWTGCDIFSLCVFTGHFSMMTNYGWKVLVNVSQMSVFRWDIAKLRKISKTVLRA